MNLATSEISGGNDGVMACNGLGEVKSRRELCFGFVVFRLYVFEQVQVHNPLLLSLKFSYACQNGNIRLVLETEEELK